MMNTLENAVSLRTRCKRTPVRAPSKRMTELPFGEEGVYGPRHSRAHRAQKQHRPVPGARRNHYFSGTAPSPAYRAACGNHKDNAVIAQRAGGKTLGLTHRLGQIDQPRNREPIVHEIQQVFTGKSSGART